jgi:alpha-tubulin suppressor-like RCC1 family protein
MKRKNKSLFLSAALSVLLTASFSPVGVQTVDACEEPHGKYQVDAGINSLFIKPDGTLWAAGPNGASGQLGDGTGVIKKQITPVKILDNVKVVESGGSQNNIAIKNDGTVWAWGDNSYGQVGVSPNVSSKVLSPSQVPNLMDVKAVDTGATFSVALRTDGSVWTWGSNEGGTLGVPDIATYTYNPVQVTSLTGVQSISSGKEHTIALKEDGTVWTWGRNTYGQLGVGQDVDASKTPVQVPGLVDVKAISAGYLYSVALKNDGTVWVWGRSLDIFGVDSGSIFTPVKIEGLEDVVHIEAGGNHTFAKKSDETVWAWGNNGVGQFGNGNTTSSRTPIQIEELTGFESLSAGVNFSLGVKSDNTVWAWGMNQSGQLGIGSTAQYKTTPVQVTFN